MFVQPELNVLTYDNIIDMEYVWWIKKPAQNVE